MPKKISGGHSQMDRLYTPIARYSHTIRYIFEPEGSEPDVNGGKSTSAWR